MRTRSLLVPALALALAGSAAADGHGTMKGKTRPATIEQIMEGIVKPHSDALKKALGAQPKSADTWKDLALHAAMLNEASFTLMDDGRSVDTVWSDASVKGLRKATQDLLKAVEGKNESAAILAQREVGKSCKACHDVHKK